MDRDGRFFRYSRELFRPFYRDHIKDGGRSETPSKAVMDTIGFIGVGKIGLPICEHLIKGGYRVLGYRRGSLADFEKLGGVAAKSPAQVGAQADVVFTCLPSDAALEEVVQGPNGLVHSARAGQIVV